MAWPSTRVVLTSWIAPRRASAAWSGPGLGVGVGVGVVGVVEVADHVSQVYGIYDVTANTG